MKGGEGGVGGGGVKEVKGGGAKHACFASLVCGEK